MLLHPVLTKKESLVEDVQAGDSLGFSDHETVEFRIECGGNRATSSIATLDFRRAIFGLCSGLLGGISWGRALEDRGVQGRWLIFRHHIN